jgi:iron(III) transport system ATP-binding protein
MAIAEGLRSNQHAAAATGDAAIRLAVRHLHKTFHTQRGQTTAVDDVSLDVRPGEILVLLGPSGCGKTTLLRCVAGLEHPDSGSILVHGKTVYSSTAKVSLPPEERLLSMVFQSYALWPHMTVFNNVAYPLENMGVRGALARERAEAVLRIVGLEAYGSAYPGQLSGGQQQRVALARAMVTNEGLILFDEPLSNLDAKVRERLRLELLKLHREIGFSALYVTHDQTEAAALGTRVAVMDAGRIVQIGTPTEVYYTPSSRYVAQFVGSANELEGTVARRDIEHVLVDTVIGPMLAVAAQPSDVSVGQRVVVLFRPEHFHFESNDTEADANTNTNTFDCEVERSIFLGGHLEYIVTTRGTTLVLKTMEGELLPAGHALRFRVDPVRVRVFAAD